jgi:DNA polymerase-3 subunit gamma/tau
MENYVVSARKYRPNTFNEVIGQQHVTNTLLNAINNNHLAQALLFTGPRGVGKTTTARILSKLINTNDGLDANQDFAFNIFELDAASNNTVDDIRSLIDQVRFAPQIGNYKVYIIDEVHMLSQAAFNAFLKTLEEPPKHAIFILATTEKHKIIPTILSRCQIYDFKRISVEDIMKHLQHVAEKENIVAEEKALRVVAQKADGALRDALSIFDRIAAFSNEKITYQSVIDNLRILDYEYYFKTVDLITAQNQAGLFNLFNTILENGFDGHLFLNGLATHLRDLLVCQKPETIALLEADADTKARYQQQAQSVNGGFLLNALKVLATADVRYKASINQRLLVELALLELADIVNPENGIKKKSLS